jgi:hypothetical protein
MFTNTNNKGINLNLLYDICVPEIIFIAKNGATQFIFNLASFIQSREKKLTDGTLLEFTEKEIQGQTLIINNIAQRHSRYHKAGVLEGKAFNQKGNKLLQFIKASNGWKLSSVLWEDESN